jgi:hypothetical protein
MLFAAINYDRPSEIVPLEGDPDADRGGVTGRRIRDCLQAYLPRHIEEGETFQHDNARTFRSKKVKDWLPVWASENGVCLTDWPPYSPDLNPIENLWKILKQRIYEEYPELSAFPQTPETNERLIQATVDVWEKIEDEVVKNVIKSMPDRLEACYQANGYYTKY